MPDEKHAQTDNAHTTHQRKNPFSAGVILIAFGTLILFAFILYFYFTLTIIDEHAKFLTSNILNALLLVAIVVQVYINRRQWEAMTQSTELANHALYVSERPYVIIPKAEVINLPFEADKLIVYEVTVENMGNTPAYDLEFLAFIDIEPYPLPVNPNYRSVRTDLSKVTLMGKPMTSKQTDIVDILSQEQVDAIRDGKLFVYIYGFARYRDGFTDKTHQTRFYLSYDPEERRFTRGGHHNDSD